MRMDILITYQPIISSMHILLQGYHLVEMISFHDNYSIDFDCQMENFWRFMYVAFHLKFYVEQFFRSIWWLVNIIDVADVERSHFIRCIMRFDRMIKFYDILFGHMNICYDKNSSDIRIMSDLPIQKIYLATQWRKGLYNGYHDFKKQIYIYLYMYKLGCDSSRNLLRAPRSVVIFILQILENASNMEKSIEHKKLHWTWENPLIVRKSIDREKFRWTWRNPLIKRIYWTQENLLNTRESIEHEKLHWI